MGQVALAWGCARRLVRARQAGQPQRKNRVRPFVQVRAPVVLTPVIALEWNKVALLHHQLV